MLHLHKGVGLGKSSSDFPMLLDSGVLAAGDGALESCIVAEFGDCTDTMDGWLPNPRLSAVQLRGPRPQNLAVSNPKNQNWCSQVARHLTIALALHTYAKSFGVSLLLLHFERSKEIIMPASDKELSFLNRCFSPQCLNHGW